MTRKMIIDERLVPVPSRNAILFGTSSSLLTEEEFLDSSDDEQLVPVPAPEAIASGNASSFSDGMDVDNQPGSNEVWAASRVAERVEHSPFGEGNQPDRRSL